MKTAIYFAIFAISLSAPSAFAGKSVCNYAAGQTLYTGVITGSTFNGCSQGPYWTTTVCHCSSATTTQSYSCYNSDGSLASSGTLNVTHYGSFVIASFLCRSTPSSEGQTENPNLELDDGFGLGKSKDGEYIPSPIKSEGIKK